LLAGLDFPALMERRPCKLHMHLQEAGYNTARWEWYAADLTQVS